MNKNNQTGQHFVSTLTRVLRKIFYFEPTIRVTAPEKKHRWQSVLCLVGLDYFSTLAYQPALALLAVGLLAPFASLLLVLVTLFGAVPTYFAVANRSFAGQGSIAMLEKLVSGWVGKFILLGLIAFAGTDFFITITLSASDAAAHIVENPHLSSFFKGHYLFGNLGISLLFVGLLGFVFFIGIREAITVAVVVTVPFLILTMIVIGRGLYEIYLNPKVFFAWLHNPVFEVSNVSFMLVIIIAFPKLALGLSGFETSVSTMPLIKTNDEPDVIPKQRIKDTQKILLSSAVIMSICLITSSVITSIFIKQADVVDGGVAAGRALSYLGHKFFGNVFGNIYDTSTILILWFAGGSAMAALLAILPRYLPRFGMAPKWVELRKPVVVMNTAIACIILIIFRASVHAQSGAYATGVLALILSAAVAVSIAFYKEWRASKNVVLKYKCFYFSIVSVIFIYTLIDNIYARPDGLIIASIFFVFILLGSAFSRWIRALELRVEKMTFANAESEELFNLIKKSKVDLVPVSNTAPEFLANREAKIKNYYKMDNPLVFLEIKLRDDRSDFISPLEISVTSLQNSKKTNYLVQVSGAVAIPNTVAYISEQLHPNSVCLGLARKNAMEQALSYILFGEGEIGILTYKVLVQYWENSKVISPHARPVIFLISE